MSLLPFIGMGRGVLLVVLAFTVTALAGCSASGSSSADTTASATRETTGTETTEADTTKTAVTSTSGSAAQAVFSIDEVGVGNVSYVTLTNFTDVSQNIEGLVLCEVSGCAVLPAKEVVKGGRVRVAAGGGKGVPGVVVATGLPDFDPADGEVAIYASGTADAPQNIVSYLEWGSTPHDRTREAIDAGLWRKGSFAPTAEDATKLVRKVDSGWWVFESG